MTEKVITVIIAIVTIVLAAAAITGAIRTLPAGHNQAVQACIDQKGIPSFNAEGYIQECKFYLLESQQQ